MSVQPCKVIQIHDDDHVTCHMYSIKTLKAHRDSSQEFLHDNINITEAISLTNKVYILYNRKTM